MKIFAKNTIDRTFLAYLPRSAKKWLTRIAIALFAAFFTASISLALPNKLKESIPHSPSPISHSQQLLQQGRDFFDSERYSQAAEVWQQAVSALKTESDRLNLAQAYNLLSIAYQQLGKWQQAEDAIASSLSLLQANQNNDNNRDKLSLLAQAFNSQGNLQLALGQAETALTTWEKAAATYSKIGDVEGAIGSQINQVQALQSLGLYRRAQKRLAEIKTSVLNLPDSLVKATGLRSLGNVSRAIGELEESRQQLQKSLQIAETLRSPAAIGAAQFSLGNTDRDLAKRAKELDDLKTAETEIQNAINAYQEAARSSTSPEMRVQAQLNQLTLLVDNKKFAEAEELRSQIQLNQLPPSRSAIYAQVNLAQNLLKLAKNQVKNYSPSLVAEILSKAIQQAKILNDTQAESYALGSLGTVYEQDGQFKEAENITQQALILAQSLNAADIAYRWQWQLGRILKQKGENKQAIDAYSTAVETLKSLRNDLVAINPDNPDVQFSFRESVEPVYREFVDLLVSTEKQPSQENLSNARSVIEDLQLAELDNFFQEACLKAKTVQIEQLDANAAVIYPIILPERLAVIVALPKSPLRYYELVKPESEINTLLNELQQDIGRPAANNQAVLNLSQQVYNWIIRPAETELKNAQIETLVFVLDGLLRNIPMAALHDGKQYLIEKYSIALTPGLQLLPTQPLKRGQLRTLAVGLSEARQGFNELPNVTTELEEIKSQVSTSEVLLNQQFTDENFQTALNKVPFPVVHIATHGQFSSNAERTYIVTWDDKIKVKQLDDLLRRREREENHPIELLVFSACETAAGDSRAALGLAGVAVRAGARSTVATLWQVSDRSTAELMTNFYSELVKPGITKSEALRQAQISLLKQNNYRFPYYWAPYVLVGNWR